MARFACDEDGWRSDRHREEAEAIVRDDVRYYAREDYLDCVRSIDPETGEGWPEAIVKASKLADYIVEMTDCPFTSSEVEAIIVDMIEGGIE